MMKYSIWLSLKLGANNPKFLMLYEKFGSAGDIYFAPTSALERASGLTREDVVALSDKSLKMADSIIEQCKRAKIGIISFEDERYPERLRNIYAPPAVLYYKGNFIDTSDKLTLSIVGTRQPGEIGKKTAKKMSGILAKSGIVIVSGIAEGIDKEVLHGAINTKGNVISVFAGGVDVIFPPENKYLIEKVAQKGMIISEYPPGTTPFAANFPIRNRIISGLCSGVIIVEAPQKSGALITARHASEQGRDVFVVPGHVSDTNYEGSNALINDGVKPVTNIMDIFEEYIFMFADKINLEKLTKNDFSLIQFDEDKKRTKTQKASQDELQKPKQQPVLEPQPQSTTVATLKPASKETQMLRSTPITNSASASATTTQQLEDGEDLILDLLKGKILTVDEIIEKTGWTSSKVLSVMLKLELKGVVKAMAGQRYSI